MRPPIVLAAAWPYITELNIGECSFGQVFQHGSDWFFNNSWSRVRRQTEEPIRTTHSWGARTFFNSSLTAVCACMLGVYACAVRWDDDRLAAKNFPCTCWARTPRTVRRQSVACVCVIPHCPPTPRRAHKKCACGCASLRIRIRCTLPRTTFTRRRQAHARSMR